MYTDKEQKILEDYYFDKFAKNNEDFAGCERWLENLADKEIEKILNI